MVTDILLEEIAAGQGQKIAQAAKTIPTNRTGPNGPRPVSLSCVLRWIIDGVRGPDGERVHLEAVKGPSGWITTPGAVSRFFVALTPTRETKRTSPRTPGQRTRASERAARQLEQIGI